ncbi:MAG TPA: adenine phosphoribosyltransferase [Acidimicrobiales bacterium]|nr:adenine phosphoribosyltransferase [Acidimicrobiales bacterium]HLN43745.1 adenine phosphoribosyltransferase [Acidimicrobiales bacterium]
MSGGTPERVGDDALRERVTTLVRDVVGFPQPDVTFKDITPVLADAAAFADTVAWLAAPFAGNVDTVAAIEARGFILGAPVAYALGTGLVPVRKVGKLPAATMAEAYLLEYGEATLEMHIDAVGPGDRVLIVDDVIATGGTLLATASVLRRAGAVVVGVAALLELAAMRGRDRLEGLDLHVLLSV